MPLTYCSPSSRERFIVNALYWPAWGVTVPAVNPGVKGVGWTQPVTSKDDDDISSGVPASNSPSDVTPGALHGVRSAVVSAGPHTAGLAIGARGPPLRWILASLKGAWTRSWETPVICPVAGLTSDSSGTLKWMPVSAN